MSLWFLDARRVCAAITGRAAHEASKSDLEQARRELTGGSEEDANETNLESASESERWDPLPGSAGGMMPASSTERSRYCPKPCGAAAATSSRPVRLSIRLAMRPRLASTHRNRGGSRSGARLGQARGR